MSETLSRFFAVEEAMRANRPRPDRTGAPFAAAALLAGEGEPEALASGTRSAHASLEAGLKASWFVASAPTGNLRWVYAALLAANGVPAERFLDVRNRLREQAKREDGPGLHAGGARAALVLCLTGEPSSYTLRRFFELKRSLTPPWWRRDNAVTDTFAAAHAARDEAPETVARARDLALAVFESDRRAKAHRREGARLCALLERDPREVLARFGELEAARRGSRYLRHRSDAALAMQWAAQGLAAEDLSAIEAIMRELPKHMTSAGHARARLAQLIHTGGGRDMPAGSVSALSAVIAAQAAAIAAVVASSTAATTAATTAAGS